MSGKKKLVVLLLIGVLLTGVVVFLAGSGVVINLSRSLPQRVFWVRRRYFKVNKGNYILFKNSQAHHYRSRTLVKMVLAIPGEQLEVIPLSKEINNLQSYLKISGTVLGVLARTSRGTLLKTLQIRTIPEGMYFVGGFHRDSYDSRYEEFGLVKQEDILGVATPIF
jgi:conjugative transfer signal peptidase TraF